MFDFVMLFYWVIDVFFIYLIEFEVRLLNVFGSIFGCDLD